MHPPPTNRRPRTATIALLGFAAAALTLPACHVPSDRTWIGAGVQTTIETRGQAVIGTPPAADLGPAYRGLEGFIAATDLGADVPPSARRRDGFHAARRLFLEATVASDPIEAIALYDQVTELVDGFAEPYNNRALLLLRTGQEPAARECLAAALTADPHYTPAARNLERLGATPR